MEEELVYLDDFFDFIAQSGIDVSLINVVNYDINSVQQSVIDANLINVVNCDTDSARETKGKLIIDEQRNNTNMEETE